MASKLVPLFTFPGMQPFYLIGYWPLSLSSSSPSSEKPCQSSHCTEAFSIYLVAITVPILLTSSLISSSTPSIPGKLGLYLTFSLYPWCLVEWRVEYLFIRLRHSNNLCRLFQINGSPSYIWFSLHKFPNMTHTDSSAPIRPL